ncbi:MAG: DNA methylase [Actinomycetota bacterium]|nr:DNA methylase [Actinomycetota bacterium]
MSNITRVTEELRVGRGDPAYMAHGYLTKVPVPAIVPFIEAYTKPGDVVLDPFAGSGMTGVAAAVSGRRALLSDISVLGQHIGSNYVNLVPPEQLRKQCGEVVRGTIGQLGELYAVNCRRCDGTARLVKRVWSTVVACASCAQPVVYYDALEAAAWHKASAACPACATPVSARLDPVGEAPVLDSISCECSPNLVDQPAAEGPIVDIAQLAFPRVEIAADRVMYQAQALGKSGRTTIASYYSDRNLAVLTVLREQIAAVDDDALRAKLLFAFTGSLTRASKRYQWSRQRPLNAANANYYVAPVFYEWNVFDLFNRKVEAAIRSDKWIRAERASTVLFEETPQLDVHYTIGSAASLALPDNSVDYIFTDPPFGSNLFYADMALFQEAWLDGFTDVTEEAVVSRGARRQASAVRYEELLTGALREGRRVLKAHGRLSMVFGNSTGANWALVQRAIRAAGLVVEPDALVVLNKGQRSVKGLASGFEHVATLDLILTMRAAETTNIDPQERQHPDVATFTRRLAETALGQAPSHLYLELLRHGFRADWNLAKVDLRSVTQSLLDDGWTIDSKTGVLQRQS